MTILVDANVILDVVTNDPVWSDWSLARLNDFSLRDEMAINDVVFAELAPSFETFEELEAAVDGMALVIRPMPRAALFLAGRAFQRYRTRNGAKVAVLPDFFIGAQAEIDGLPLLTRDPKRFRTYFPTVELITPLAFGIG